MQIVILTFWEKKKKCNSILIDMLSSLFLISRFIIGSDYIIENKTQANKKELQTKYREIRKEIIQNHIREIANLIYYYKSKKKHIHAFVYRNNYDLLFSQAYIIAVQPLSFSAPITPPEDTRIPAMSL